MLVLSRQKDETIMIGDDVEITIVDIKGERVRVGIKAPTRIAVHRKEVYDAIKAEREADDRRHGPTHQCDTSCPPHTKPAPPVKNTRGNKPPKGSFCSPPSSSAVAAA